MAVITIREEGRTEEGFKASLHFDGVGNYPLTITEPFTPKQEGELEWYFERWINRPFLNQVKAGRAAGSVKDYGENLFKQIFKADFDAYGEYKNLRGQLSQVEIVIESRTPEFQAFHWEAMLDPDMPRPLSVQAVMVRKTVKRVAVQGEVDISPVINVLVVTARPKEDEDIGYRTTSRPLIAAIANSPIPVNVDLLRPGTYEALVKHLEAKGAGFYHILHFDGHGSLASYETLNKIVENPSKLLKRYGRTELQPYEGRKAFLYFEGEKKGESDPVEAQEFTNLLTGKRIPVCILDACQSGKQVRGEGEEAGETEMSLGSQLMAAGMQMVIGMSYSVSVSAAGLLMEEIYSHLCGQKSFREAIRLGRLELLNNKERQGGWNQTIELEDWLLPVVYSHSPVNLQLRQFDPQEEEDFYNSQAVAYRFSEPEYGFVGRELEILKIEKALLRHNILLLRGMGGTGKTTLLHYLRQWWQVTNFAEKIFYFGYDEKPWTLAQIVHNLGKEIYDRFEQGRFQAMNPKAQAQKLIKELKSKNYILILDNLESVTGQQLAIQNTLTEEQQGELRNFLSQLKQGKTKVILGSRSGEEWLQKETFQRNSYQLPGLDQQSRSILAERILQRQVGDEEKIASYRQSDEFNRLMTLLGGYPLAMEVVLGNLKRQSPQEVLEGMEAGEVALDTGSEEKTESIVKCVEYSHSNLSGEAQRLLLCLAPFRKFIHFGVISNYVEELQKLAPFQDYDFTNFAGAIQEAINWGLLSPSEQDSPLLTIQPVFPYFLKTKLKDLGEETGTALEEGFKNHYVTLAKSYDKFMGSKEAEKRKLGILFCRLEYENLYSALQVCLRKQETVDIFFCLGEYFDLINDIPGKLKLAELVVEGQAAYPEEVRRGEIGLEILMTKDSMAYCYWRMQRYQEAKHTYEQLAELYQKLTGIEEKNKQAYLAMTYHQLGVLAQDLREFDQAQQYHQQALDIDVEFGNTYNLATTYHQLGVLAQDLREFAQAQQYFQQSLDLKVEYGNTYEQARTLNNLGVVAQELREFAQAQQYFQQALDICVDFDDHYFQAAILNNLGIVAQKLREFFKAKQYFQQTLDIYVEYGNTYEQTRTLHNLGTVAKELQEFAQAQQYFQQALDIYVDVGDRYEQARTLHNLGVVAQELQEFAQAQQYFQQALDICVEYGDTYEQARSLHYLGIVTQELREYAQAQQYYQQALDIYVASGDTYSQASTLHQLGIVAQKLREFDQAQQYYQQALDIYVASGDTYSQASTLHQLGIVAQKLREFDQAQQYYQQALDIYVASGDTYSQASTLGQLGLLAEAQEDIQQARSYLQQALEIYVEFKDEYYVGVVQGNLERLGDGELGS